MRKFIILIAAALAMAGSAQEKGAHDYGDFTVDAQVRARGEYRGGMSSDGKDKLFVNDRVRLSFGWERKNLSMKVSAQHAGLWQSGTQNSTLGKITLHEAWAKMTFGKGFFTQVGRQELAYDDERLLGTLDWAPSGRAHDALRLGWENRWNKLHAVVSFNQTAEVQSGSSTSSRLYKNLQMLWYRLGPDEKPFHISTTFINQGVDDVRYDSIRYMQTFGIYASFEKRKISTDFSIYYQTGRDRTGADQRAFMMSGNFGWQFARKWKGTIGDDYLSGSDGMPGTNRTFNVLYGTHHKFLGTMDNFGYNTIPLYGLNDLHLNFAYNCSEKFDMSFAYHWFATGRPINDYLKDPIEQLTDPAKIAIMRRYYGKYRFSQNLGGELDLQFNYCPWKDVCIQGGFSLMFATESMRFIKDTKSKVQKWGWLSFNINPTVFSTRNRK